MDSKPMNKHRLRLIATGLVALLALTTMAHLMVTAGHSKGGGYDGTADEEGMMFFFTPQNVGPGDHLISSWERFGVSFQPIFQLDTFYVAADIGDSFDPARDRILFHAQDNDPNGCCQDNSRYSFDFPSDAEKVTFVWMFHYRPGWAPAEPATTPDPIAGGDTVDTTMQERELSYINAFVDKAAHEEGSSVLATYDVQSGTQRAVHPGFIAAEALIGLAALVLWVASSARPAAPDADGALGTVQKGVRALRAQLRLHVLVGPMLLIAGLFGLDAMDNGAFGIRDPTGIADDWTVGIMLGLWLIAITTWGIGLVRTIKALRHYKDTQEPDLGDVGA